MTSEIADISIVIQDDSVSLPHATHRHRGLQAVSDRLGGGVGVRL